MKKIGILTLYYQSSNYGGLLQSYALCKAFEKRGLCAEQIQYNNIKGKGTILRRLLRQFRRFLFSIIKSKGKRNRENSCKLFRDSIPHSSVIYCCKTISKANNVYDIFIIGSDQVWNPYVFDIGFSGLFTEKNKIAYAASIASSTIPSDRHSMYQLAINSFDFVSVREKSAQELLSFNNAVELVLDPVFLLSQDEWLACSSKRIMNEKYVFCYFLGDDTTYRSSIRELCIKNGFRLVYIPFLNQDCLPKENDGNYFFPSSVSPNVFLSLVKFADYVFTDSFHAICFSYIFRKSFYVFSRNGGEHMNSRIVDILSTLNLKNRYVSGLDSLIEIDYDLLDKNEFNDLLAKSNEFLDKVLSVNKNED